MGVISQILLSIKADTKQARREVKKLAGDQKKAAQEVVDSLEDQNSKLDDTIAKYGKVTLAIGAVAAGVKLAGSAIEAFNKRSRLELGAAGTNIGRLQEAAKGLITETQALELAAVNNASAFKLTEKQLADVAGGMIALRNKGVAPLNEILEQTKQAIIEGNVEPLKKFGIVLTEASGTMAATTAIAEALAKEANSVAGQAELAGDEMSRLAVKGKDAWENIKAGAGEATLEVVGFAAETLGSLNAVDALGVTIVKEFESARRVIKDAREELERFSALAPAAAEFGNAFLESFAESTKESAIKTSEAFEKFATKLGAETTLASRRGIEKRQRRKGSKKEPTDPFDTLTDFDLRDGDGDISDVLGQFNSTFLSDSAPAFVKGVDMQVAAIERLAEAQRMANEEFQANILASEGLQIGLSAVTNAANQAFSAWVNGSVTAGEAVKQFFGNTLKGLATEMFSRALFHGAAAIGALAIGGPLAGATAAQHGKAAAAFAAGAAITGGLAVGFGGGGAPVSGGGAPAVEGLGGAAAGAGGGNQQIIVSLGNQFSGEDRRRNADKFSRAFRRAQQYSGMGSGVIEFS